MSLVELQSLIERHARGARGVIDTAIPGVVISRMDESRPQDETTTGTILAIVAQATKRLVVGSTVHDYGPGDFLVASVDLPVSGQYQDATPGHPALGFGLLLRPEVIAELLLAAPAAPHARGEVSPAAVGVGRASDRMLDAAVRMLRLLDSPDDIPVLAPFIERELLWLVMNSSQGSAVRQLGLADSGLARVRRVARWLRENVSAPVRVEELARQASMSTSAFHRAFQSVTAMSPIQFQKTIRLQEARLRLLADPTNVAGVAHSVGYESASQFSREYRRQFGEPPSRDVAALRGA